MSSREDRLWSALLKKYHALVAELDQVADREADALADAYATGTTDVGIRAIEREAKAESLRLRAALSRLKHEALKLPCGCVCDRCYLNKGHCTAAHCKHNLELLRDQR